MKFPILIALFVNALFTLEAIAHSCHIVPSSLPQNAIELIEKHSISKLKKIHGNGEKIRFSSNDFRTDLVTGEKPVGSFGETVQAQFVKETLMVLFPQAEFVSGFDQQPTKRKNISIRITDSAEDFLDGMVGALEGNGALEMGILKQANPSKKMGNLRAQLPLQNDSLVVSVYASRWNFPEVPKIIQALNRLNKSIVLILTGGGSAIEAHEVNQYPTLASAIRNTPQVLLSELPKNTEPAKLKVVLNNTFGRMPEIYSAVDLAIVVGPINIIEPVGAGTPTIFATSRKLVSEYPYFQDMSAIAKSTGRGFAVDTFDSFDAVLADALNSRSQEFKEPYLIRLPGKKSPFERYLDHLEDYLK